MKDFVQTAGAICSIFLTGVVVFSGYQAFKVAKSNGMLGNLEKEDKK